MHSIEPADNRIVLSTGSELYTQTLIARDLNMISVPFLDGEKRLTAKVRSRQTEQWATVRQTDADTLEIHFDIPQRAVTRGQAVVLYDGDTVVGGGTIEQTI